MEERLIQEFADEISDGLHEVLREVDYLLAKRLEDNDEFRRFSEDDRNYDDESILKESAKMFIAEQNVTGSALNKQRLKYNKICRKISLISEQFIVEVASGKISHEFSHKIVGIIKQSRIVFEKATSATETTEKTKEIGDNLVKRNYQINGQG